MTDKKKGREDSGEPPGVALDEFLISCQKSLARTVQNAEQAGKSASEFATGQRAIYVIDELEFDLNAGLHAPVAGAEAQRDRVMLDFSAPPEARSRVKFRVATRPMETIAGARLEISMLTPPSGPNGLTQFRVWLVNSEGSPVPDHPVELYFARSGSKRRNLRKPIPTRTDVVGRVDFYVDVDDHTVKVAGDRTRHEVYLQGDGGEFFVWATAERAASWKAVAEPAPPRPPIAIKRSKDGLPETLYTQVVQVKIGGGRKR
jgi:hypothetical protein